MTTEQLRSDLHSLEPIREADKDSTGIPQMWSPRPSPVAAAARTRWERSFG